MDLHGQARSGRAFKAFGWGKIPPLFLTGLEQEEFSFTETPCDACDLIINRNHRYSHL